MSVFGVKILKTRYCTIIEGKFIGLLGIVTAFTSYTNALISTRKGLSLSWSPSLSLAICRPCPPYVHYTSCRVIQQYILLSSFQVLVTEGLVPSFYAEPGKPLILLECWWLRSALVSGFFSLQRILSLCKSWVCKFVCFARCRSTFGNWCGPKYKQHPAAFMLILTWPLGRIFWLP